MGHDYSHVSVFEGTHEIWVWKDVVVGEVGSWGRDKGKSEEKMNGVCSSCV